MQLNTKTLEQLRIIINGDETSDKRSGPKLVGFFMELGFEDEYGQGFPSRWAYTDEKLKQINGTPNLEQCIRNTFSVINFVGRISYLDSLIDSLNQYMAFDKWMIIRDNNIITFKQLDEIIINTGNAKLTELKENDFLKQSFTVNIDALNLDPNVNRIIKSRLTEIEKCINNDASLASIFLIGSTMEGLLFAMASIYPQQYNQAQSAPKEKDGKIKRFSDWTLNNFIDVSFEIGLLNQDVKRFSHVVRDFRNYIHPYEQMKSKFYPDKQTALICFQVLKAALSQIENFRKNKQEELNHG